MIPGHLEMAVAAAAEGHRDHGGGLGELGAAGAVMDLDLGGDERVAVGAAQGIGHHPLGGGGEADIGVARHPFDLPPALVLGLHVAGQGGAADPLDAAIGPNPLAKAVFGHVLEPGRVIGIVLEAGVGVFKEPVGHGDAVGRGEDLGLFAPLDNLGAQSVVGGQDHKIFRSGTGAMHAQVV